MIKRNDFKDKKTEKKPLTADFDADISEDIVIGRNCVIELLDSSEDIDKVYIASGVEEAFASKISVMCRNRGIPFLRCDKRRLDAYGTNNQGVAAVKAKVEYCSVDDILNAAREKNEKPFIVICDGINDPHNLGAIIRNAECAGVHGVIIPKRRSAGINTTVSKSSAGATAHMNICKVTNIADTVNYLQQNGVWVYCVETGGNDFADEKYNSPSAFVYGSEGDGVSQLVKSKSDFIVSIPMFGNINSLNVSAASAITLFHAARFLKAK